MAAGKCDEVIYIYALCEPDTGEMRYIGKTNNPELRLHQHWYEAKRSKHRNWKCHWIKSMRHKPILKVLEECGTDNWVERERFWIEKGRAEGWRLVNFADGGQEAPLKGKKHSLETRHKMREAALRDGRRPPGNHGPMRDETRQKMSETRKRLGTRPPVMCGWNRGKKMSQEYIEVNRRAHKGIPWSAARRAAQNRRKEVGV